MFQPRIIPYTWKDRKTGQHKAGANFKCLLVSLADRRSYMLCQLAMKDGKKEPLEDALKRFKENTSFRMSNVHFVNKSAQEYVHAPIKFVVDLGKTKMDPLMSQGDGQSIQAEPAMTLTEVKELQQHQRFDVTALVAEVGEPRPISSTRKVRDIQIIDHSFASESKVQQIKFGFFYDEGEKNSSATIDILRQAEGSAEPVSFFGLDGKMVCVQGQQGFNIENSSEFFAVSARGDRASSLTSVAETLHATPTESREVLQQGLVGAYKDYKDEQGKLSLCKLLKTTVAKTNIEFIDENDTLWQLNWVEVAWPTGSEDDLCTKKKERLWFETEIHDVTGQGPRVRMNEESALALAQVSSKDEFLALHAAGKQAFPPMAAVKILRTTSRSK